MFILWWIIVGLIAGWLTGKVIRGPDMVLLETSSSASWGGDWWLIMRQAGSLARAA